MFKFPWDKSPRKPFVATEATRKAFGLAPINEATDTITGPATDKITADFIAAATVNAAAGVPPRPDIYKVEKHLKTAADMLAGLEARKDKLEIEGQIEEEEYEKADTARREKFARESREAIDAARASNAKRAEEIDEINRLIRFYSAAETLTAPVGSEHNPAPPIVGALEAERKAKPPRQRRKPGEPAKSADVTFPDPK